MLVEKWGLVSASSLVIVLVEELALVSAGDLDQQQVPRWVDLLVDELALVSAE